LLEEDKRSSIKLLKLIMKSLTPIKPEVKYQIPFSVKAEFFCANFINNLIGAVEV